VIGGRGGFSRDLGGVRADGVCGTVPNEARRVHVCDGLRSDVMHMRVRLKHKARLRDVTVHGEDGVCLNVC
jgi:hypothetical protein